LRERRGHNEQTRFEIAQQRKREIGFEMPFVKFVENDNAVWAQPSAAQQSVGQDAFGEIPELGAGAANLLEANLKAYRFSDRFTHLFSNAPRRHARGETARFEDIDLVITGFEESRWNARGFASARLGL